MVPVGQVFDSILQIRPGRRQGEGTISLKDVVQPSGQYTERAKIVAKPHCLLLHTRQRTYFFAAETEEELERWMKAISEATTKCNGQ